MAEEESREAAAATPEENEDVAEETEDAGNEAGDSPVAQEKSEKLLQFPFGRIKNLMKLDPDLGLANRDAVFAVAKATELFVECLAVECYSYTERAGKKTVAKADFDRALEGADCLAFLEGALED